MTQAAPLQSGLLPRIPVAFPNRQVDRGARSTPLVGSSVLPAARPGQLWFTVHTSSEHDPAPLVCRAVTTVNVIIYDRLLTPTVSRLLPLGGYAEPAADGAGGHTTAERCLGFLRDGWSVARLVHPGRDWRGEIRHLSAVALSANVPADLPVALFADHGGCIYESSATRLGELDDVIDGPSAVAVPVLTFVFEAIATDTARRFAAASTNGLAG